MAQMYFKTLPKAEKAAEKRNKKVYKLKGNLYYVGTYEGATKAWGKLL